MFDNQILDQPVMPRPLVVLQLHGISNARDPRQCGSQSQRQRDEMGSSNGIDSMDHLRLVFSDQSQSSWRRAKPPTAPAIGHLEPAEVLSTDSQILCFIQREDSFDVYVKCVST